jgi:CMP-N,N'-diacetyllegionaminic acid synthase
MHKDKTTLAIITARGGSKSIPKKNIKELGGKPLIAHTIEAAKGSKLLTRTIVSTDCDEIAEVCRTHGADVPFKRPKEYAEDHSTSMEVVQHALGWLDENEGEEYDYLMILQPTSPLRTSEDIDECIKRAVEHDADSVMSMKELEDFSPKKMKKIEDDVIVPYFEDEGKESSRRQDLSPMYKRNCAIYLTKTEHIKRGDLFGKKSVAYVMPEERSVDINAPIDFEMAEFLLRRKFNAK